MNLLVLLKGFGVGGSLIIAIGAQNAFVLSSAVRGQHVKAVAGLCMLIDVILIIAGIWGLSTLIRQYPSLITIATWGGALFLLVYGAIAFRNALNPQNLSINHTEISLTKSLITVLALSLLNPHVYLDTVILLGTIGGQLPGNQPWWFAMGACIASVCWFTLLSYAGKRLAPWFTNPRNWRYLDIAIGSTMWVIALGLIYNS